jgi:hypothetical protein
MLFSTSSALASLEHVNAILEGTPESGGSQRRPVQDEVLDGLQNIVLQGGSLSRYFWPIRPGREARGELLRAACGVTEGSPLKSRELRNALEHFDERLDDYLMTSIVGFILPQYVGPLPEREEVPSHIFRAYYTDHGLFELLGNRYPIDPIVGEIGRIHERLTYCSEHGGRLQAP